MLEQSLGKWGFRVFFSVLCCLLGYAVWAAITNHGLPGWLNRRQAGLFGGWYSGKLTIVVAAIPSVGVSYLSGLLIDWLMGEGIFAPGKSETPAEDNTLCDND